MALNKSRINLVFAFIIAALGLTAGASLYLNRSQPEIQAVPESNPSTDAANRLAALEQMSAKDPNNAEYLTQIANAYYDLGQYDKAADVYQKSLDVRPQDPNVETDLATCFHYLGQHDKALQTLDKVLAYSPNFPQAMFNKGIVLVNGRKDIKAGIAVWEDLLRSDPGFSKRAEIEQRINQLKASAR
jgi:cytochrome c-type biogenesis protein CcmH/NrfG